MKKNNGNEGLCHSVFKNGDNVDTRQFTQKWIEVINQIEKSKCVKVR